MTPREAEQHLITSESDLYDRILAEYPVFSQRKTPDVSPVVQSDQEEPADDPS